MSTPPQLHLQPIPTETRDTPPPLSPLPPIPPSIADRNRRFYPSPANSTPTDLFTVRPNTCNILGYRFIRKNDKTRSQALFFIDGACLDNGADGTQREPRGGAAVVVGPKVHYYPTRAALGLDGIRHTSNRAELRAATFSLTLRYWPGEGFDNIVLATDSEYLVLGISERIHRWKENGWKAASGRPVANRDMWEALLKGLRELEKDGCHVQFWLIPREWNEADKYAKEAAAITDEDRKDVDATRPVVMMERGTEKYSLILSYKAMMQDNPTAYVFE